MSRYPFGVRELAPALSDSKLSDSILIKRVRDGEPKKRPQILWGL